MTSAVIETYEWVELLDPKSQRTMYVNLDSGECCWEPPKNKTIKPLSSNQWWELFDVNAQRNYYYNSITRETVWQKPADGDIIPLANLQLLQQNMQMASATTHQVTLDYTTRTLDIGVLRRSNSKVSSTTGSRRVHTRKTPTCIPECNSQPSSDLDHSSRTEIPDCSRREEPPVPRRTSIDPMNLAAEQLHRLSTQNTASGYRPYGNQRVRDWLLEAGVTWEYPITDAIEAAGQTVLDNSDSKNSGCLSDRPARRIHTLASPANAQSELPPSDHSPLSVSTPNVETMAERAAVDVTVARSGSNKPDLSGAWNPEEVRHCSESSRPQRDLRFISGSFVKQPEARVSLAPSSTSDKTDGPWVKGNPGGEFATCVSQNAADRADTQRENTNQSRYYNGKQNQQQQQKQQHAMFKSERTVQPVPKSMNVDKTGVSTHQRAFPRTNPTASRPSPGGTVMRPARFSATTLDRPMNSSHPCVSSGDQRNSTGSVVLVQRNPAFNVVHFSNTDLRAAVPSTTNRTDPKSYPADGEGKSHSTHSVPQTSFDHASSSEMSFTLSNHPTAKLDYYQQDVKASPLNNNCISNHNGTSPNSSSPQPSSSTSSSSSSSFSRASSGTALTNTDSSENKQIVHSVPERLLDSVVHEFSGPQRASLNQQEKTVLDFNPFQKQQQPTFCVTPGPEKIDSGIDPEQPPIPPPRSASTLGPNRVSQHCTSDFYRLSESGGMFIRSDPFALTKRPYTLYYPRYPNNVVLPQQMPHGDAALVSEGRVVSSLSRKDPARANVIPPNHRRPPPFVYQARPPYPMSGHTTIYYVHPFDGLGSALNYPINSSVCPSTVNHRLSSTSSPLLPSTAMELCGIESGGNAPLTGATSPSTATTWVSHSTATWDLEKSRAEQCPNVPSSQVELQSQPPTSSAQLTEVPSQTSGVSRTMDTTTSTSILPRSPSGGFIGPEELNDSVWFSSFDRDRAGVPSLPLFTLVQPGHPQFPAFISPFDWPRTLFKPDQDVVSLMSWTKSSFSKRLLLSTEPNMKKQAADTFKIVQSFMGDRKARLSLPDYGSIIVHRALNTVSLRDEIFAQLCKQTTGNPDIKSLTNGWALICVCLHYFPPNSKFRDALLAYLNTRAEAAVSLVFPSTTQSLKKVPSSLETAAAIASGLAPIVSELKPISNGHGPSYSQGTNTTRASTVGSVKSDVLLSESSELIDSELPISITGSACGRRTNAAQSNGSRQFEFTVGLWDRPTAAHFARVAPRWFIRALNVGPRKLLEAPSIEEICHVKDFILKPSIFGGTLTEMMRIQAYRFPHLRLPWIQIFLTEELLRLNGPVTEGVFRLSPDLDLVTEIRCQFEKLFEIFRVVHVCVLESEPVLADDQEHPPDCFRILRPPPAGWSLSLREFEPETAPSVAERHRTESQQSTPALANSVQLAGTFTWPLTPTRISSPPSEYVLLTPTDQWPRCLSSMAARLSTGEVQIDPHLAAGLLKLWLREMADPLVPVDLQPECLKAACQAEIFESQNLNGSDPNLFAETVSNPNPIHECCSLVRKIPPLERRSLLYLILLLQHLAKRENASRSLMDPRNLATVIAPNLMRSSSTNPRDLLENIRPQTLFVRLLITYLDVDTELQHLLASERTEADLCVLTEGSTVWSRDPGCNVWNAPVRVRLGPDNGFLPA